MTPLKLYLLVGLVFLMSAVLWMNSNRGEDLAWAGVLCSVLGLMQPHVSLPKNVKYLSVFALVAAVLAVAAGKDATEMVGGGIALLVLLIQIFGVLRHHDPSRAQQ